MIMRNRPSQFMRFVTASGIAALSSLPAVAPADEAAANWTVPGTVRTTWVGNSFKGDSGSGDFGHWMQNTVVEIEVTPGGTVLTASAFDENGRTVSLYRDGKPNWTKFKQYDGRGGHVVWGWGTASFAVAYAGEHVFIANTNGDLLRFRWEPDKLNSQVYVDQVRYAPGDAKESNKLQEQSLTAIAMSARDDQLALLQRNGTVQLWARLVGDIGKVGELKVEGASDLAIDAQGALWMVVGGQVVRMDSRGQRLASIDDAGKPSAVAIAPQGWLVVCDDGPRQQVRVYDVSDEPRLLRTYGREGGLLAGDPPGKLAPDIFYSLRGANYDEAGNLYVAFSTGSLSNSAGTTLRSYKADSDYEKLWDLKSLAFVDCFAVDPASDGKVLYSSQEILSFDPDAPDGENWNHQAMTVDPITYPDEKRDAGGIQFARVNGRRLMAYYSQHQGVSLYAFRPDSDSHIARPVYGEDGKFHGGGWGWHLDAEGSLWSSDAGGDKIQRWRLQGWDDDGMPIYDRENPEEWPRPEGWSGLERIYYETGTDTLYLSGTTPEFPGIGWGLAGRVIQRYDNWTRGDTSLRFTIKDLPLDNQGRPPKSITVAGDYIFVGACWHSGGGSPSDGQKPLMVYVYRTDSGEYVGHMWVPWKPQGILDTRQAINAFRRANGQYMIIVEEVYRGKNIVYLWNPPEARP